MTSTLLLRVAGVLIVIGGLALAGREQHLAFRHLVDPRPGSRPLTSWFWRRMPLAEFSDEGKRHWRRAGWIAPISWLVGGILLLASL